MTVNQKLRLSAQIAGLLHYTPNSPCRNGHLTKRFSSSGACAQCLAKSQSKYHARTRGKARVSADQADLGWGVEALLPARDYSCGAQFCDDQACNTHGAKNSDDELLYWAARR